MAGNPFTSSSVPANDIALSGGLNSTSGPLNVKDNESSDLQNIDFNKFGSILKRNGYVSAGTGTLNKSVDGLHWFELASGGTSNRMAIAVCGGSMFVSALSGVWTGVSNGVAITSGSHCDFDNFMHKVFVTTGTDTPFYYAGSGSCNAMTVPSGVTRAKYIKQFNNYLFIGNVAMGATDMPSRIYWSNIIDPNTWASDQFIEISKDDGQPITGLKVLADRLVIYKERAIYNLYFTGDADIPFILPGGGKSNSTVGCIAPWSIQELENGHVFLSYDGIYYYDGMNSYKLSDKISSALGVDRSTTATTIFDYTKFGNAVSCVQKAKNRYFLALTSSTPTSDNNNGVIVWDYYNNAFSVYSGMAPSAMCTFYVSGLDERPYFGDFNGYLYRMDYGADDYPLDVRTAINAYYYTNWKTFQDLCDQKGIPHIYLYYRNNSCWLSLSYNYDFQSGDTNTQSFSLQTSGGNPLWGSVIWGQFNWATSGGGQVARRDLTGRGRVVRLKFANNILGETFTIDGLGSYVHAETNV